MLGRELSASESQRDIHDGLLRYLSDRTANEWPQSGGLKEIERAHVRVRNDVSQVADLDNRLELHTLKLSALESDLHEILDLFVRVVCPQVDDDGRLGKLSLVGGQAQHVVLECQLVRAEEVMPVEVEGANDHVGLEIKT